MIGIIRYFYPDLKKEEIQKFGLLSLTFFCIIGAYWLLRLLKDAIFFKIAFPESLGWVPEQGGLFQPLAKTYSVVVVFFLVIIYTKLVDWFQKQTLFYIICSFYAVIFSGFTGILIAREIWGDATLGKTTLAAFGWSQYFAIESFGSILVALFWSFTASITTTDAAKRGYPLIIAGAQIGAISGSALTIFSPYIGSIWPLFLLAALIVTLVIFLISYFIRVIPAKDLIGNPEAAATEKKKEGFIEGFTAGIRLLLTRKYLFGVLIISTFYEIIATIIDYLMKRQANIYPVFPGETGFAQFMGIFGVASNGIALLLALIGTSYFLKQYGIKFCLLIYPITFGFAISLLYLFYYFGAPSTGQLLWATFGVMMIAKGLSYAVNNPTKEMMYIPTSKDAKFKAKGWVDMFGGRSAKWGGAQINNIFKHNFAHLITFGTFFGLGLVGIWLIAAIFVGNENERLRREGKIIE